MALYPAQKHVLKTCAKLVELLPETDRLKPQILFLTSEVTPFRNDTDREIAFRQESNFFYLSGCHVPSSFLLVTYQAGTSLEQTPSVELFIPEVEPADLMWSVPPPNLDIASKTHDVTKVAHTTALTPTLTQLLAAFPSALIHTLPPTSLFPTLPPQYRALLGAGANVTDAYLLGALHRARLLKTDPEIALIRRANAISSRAHEVVMRVLGAAVKGALRGQDPASIGARPALPGEWLVEKEQEAEALFVASCRREGAVHQAYLPICAASTRAATLHYCCNGGNDKEFAWGPVGAHDRHNHGAFAQHDGQGGPRQLAPQVLLIDAGCEWSCYASDITRTMPVGNGGKFTPEARAIYELVHAMQKEAFSLLRPGVHWDAVHLATHRVLVRGLQRLGILKSPRSANSGSWNAEEAPLAAGVSAAFYPHGLGHSLGMDVHDVPSASKPAVNATIPQGDDDGLGNEAIYAYLRLRLPLEEGMVVTVEPGCYFHRHLLAAVRDSKHVDLEVLRRYESVGGVRIEDVVRITADGYENLTTVPSDVQWIEGVCSGAL
ncbi:Creatinase/aminopeptidase [Punctularia strigosozonata HHB-11173 SS5]|uniref:Creatinase/aminopeptidase n=1 Tax=Punctularia strigosozonata (strain HHB-11173) TaxID=741275 RepID=R7S2U7_PUNST|nr:Creatinase/aminopeptidase [Punctularia strigosozonata HHB-11173 SS5]EIN04117.1 Creatinase/aminopeptidase [Punctularia strigosozonata HHB-11173 SS5]